MNLAQTPQIWFEPKIGFVARLNLIATIDVVTCLSKSNFMVWLGHAELK